MADRDEYDALLDEPFGSDVDWTAVDGMADPPAGSPADSDEYFNDDEVLDESFLRELRQLEYQALGRAISVSAAQPATNLATRPTAISSRFFHPNSTIPRQSIAGTSSAATVQPARFSEPGPSRSTVSRAQRSAPALESALPSWVLGDGRAQTPYILDPPPVTSAAATAVDISTWPSPHKRTKTPRQTPSPPTRKRHKPSIGCSDVSPDTRAKCNARQTASKLIEAINNALQCPICFDTIAASHILSCGHSACGLCLCEWIRVKGDMTTCCICRAPHRGQLIPNYALDDMIMTYYNETGKSSRVERGESDAGDRKRWERRCAEGKAAVQAAAHKTIRKAAPATVVLAYNPSDGPYEDDDDGPDDDGPYVDGLYEDDDLDENGYLIW